MLNSTLAEFYARDLRKLVEDINLFKNEENLWKIHGSIRNSSGILALHIIGGTNYLFGTILAHTGYVRDRDQDAGMTNPLPSPPTPAYQIRYSYFCQISPILSFPVEPASQ